MKLWLIIIILEKIVSYLFIIIYHASNLIILFLDDLTVIMKVIRVKPLHLAMMPC
jgi:hypothetical protein